MSHYKANKHRGRSIYRPFSKTNDCGVKVESLLERSYMHMLDCDPHVVRFACQPETMEITDVGSYTPDFLVERDNAPDHYTEVHHTEFIDSTFEAKLPQFREYSLLTSGRDIQLVTERHFPKVMRENLQLVHFQMAVEPCPDLDAGALPEVSTFKQLVEAIKPMSKRHVAQAYRLIADGRYYYQVDGLLSANTRVVKVLNYVR